MNRCDTVKTVHRPSVAHFFALKRFSARWKRERLQLERIVIPRSREACESISVNALGYAGALFVRDEGELEKLRRLGPMKLLGEVGCGRANRTRRSSGTRIL